MNLSFEAKVLRCGICGKFMSFTIPPEEVGHYPIYSWNEPPEEGIAHKKCLDTEIEIPEVVK